jgi:hypothetical protein
MTKEEMMIEQLKTPLGLFVIGGFLLILWWAPSAISGGFEALDYIMDSGMIAIVDILHTIIFTLAYGVGLGLIIISCSWAMSIVMSYR